MARRIRTCTQNCSIQSPKQEKIDRQKCWILAIFAKKLRLQPYLFLSLKNFLFPISETLTFPKGNLAVESDSAVRSGLSLQIKPTIWNKPKTEQIVSQVKLFGLLHAKRWYQSNEPNGTFQTIQQVFQRALMQLCRCFGS